MASHRLPKLPALLQRKIYKTGQTRGADDDEIFQNRVSRSSTVLIPYPVWKQHFTRNEAEKTFESGYIVLVSPELFFGELEGGDELNEQGLGLGRNALVFYETRAHWTEYNPEELGWRPAKSRTKPLRGKFVARVPATTSAEKGERIVRGFDTTAQKGAGIRVYEYAIKQTNEECRLQLEGLFWMCADSLSAAVNEGMAEDDAARRRDAILEECNKVGLLDVVKLREQRILSGSGVPVCPLCLEELSGADFFSRLEQAEGREVVDLTVTQISLFHVQELRMGMFNHRPYNLGWGHHHCNVVAKDAGIVETLEWMRTVLVRNGDRGDFSIAE